MKQEWTGDEEEIIAVVADDVRAGWLTQYAAVDKAQGQIRARLFKTRSWESVRTKLRRVLGLK